MKRTKNIHILPSKNNFNDKVYTPVNVAKEIIDWVNPSGTILEPFRGDGAFYNELKKRYTHVLWTEIDKGKDFFNFNEKVDFIISNPPYKDFTKILKHSFKIAKNVIYLIPLNKIYTSDTRMDMIQKYMWKDINHIKIKRIENIKEWKINFPLAAVWIKINSYDEQGYSWEQRNAELIKSLK